MRRTTLILLIALPLSAAVSFWILTPTRAAKQDHRQQQVHALQQEAAALIAEERVAEASDELEPFKSCS